jgi:hypothetical protein
MKEIETSQNEEKHNLRSISEESYSTGNHQGGILQFIQVSFIVSQSLSSSNYRRQSSDIASFLVTIY